MLLYLSASISSSVQWGPGVCWEIFNQLSREEKPLFTAFAYFQGVNIPTMASFKLPIWRHWTRNWEEMPTTSSPELAWDGSSNYWLRSLPLSTQIIVWQPCRIHSISPCLGKYISLVPKSKTRWQVTRKTSSFCRSPRRGRSKKKTVLSTWDKNKIQNFVHYLYQYLMNME